MHPSCSGAHLWPTCNDSDSLPLSTSLLLNSCSSAFLISFSPHIYRDLEDLPDDEDAHVEDLTVAIDVEVDNVISVKKAEQECYEELGISKLMERTSMTITFQHDYNQFSPIEQQKYQQNDLDYNHHNHFNGEKAKQVSFSDYNFWKTPLDLDLELPDVEDEETSSSNSSSGSEDNLREGGYTGEYDDEYEDEEEYEDGDTEDEEESELRKMMEKTIADIIRGDPIVSTPYVSSYSQEQVSSIFHFPF